MDTTLRPDPTTPVLTVDDVAHLGTTVCVFAHPDDETYLAGGLMAALRRAGRRVVCVTATPGEAGAGGSDRRALARTRTAELAACLGVLGVTEHEWLGYADQECSRADPDEAATAVQAVLDRVRPDTVVAFGPDGFTGHPDHRAVAAWTQRAVEACRPRPRLLQPVLTAADLAAGRDLADAYDVYAEGLPRICRDDELAARLVLAGPLLDRKVAALRAHASQTGGLVGATGIQRYTDWVRVESFADPAHPDTSRGRTRTPAARDPAQ